MIRHPATMIRGKPVPDNPKLFRDEYSAYPNGTKLWIQLSRKRGVSDPVRRYYYGLVLEMIQNFTGHGKDELHEFFKRHFLGTEKDEHGIEVVPSVFSDKSKLTHEERVQFIEDVRMFAASTLDMSIPDPDPEWRKKK